MYTGGTTLLTESYAPAEKARTQGANDFIVFAIDGGLVVLVRRAGVRRGLGDDERAGAAVPRGDRRGGPLVCADARPGATRRDARLTTGPFPPDATRELFIDYLNAPDVARARADRRRDPRRGRSAGSRRRAAARR